MTDREKVIKALECRKNADKRCGNPCERTGMCNYAKAIHGLDGEIYYPSVPGADTRCSFATSAPTLMTTLTLTAIGSTRTDAASVSGERLKEIENECLV